VVKNVTEAADKYYLVLASLGDAQVERVHNVLDEEPGENAYQKLEDTLLATHTLTPFQMVDKIVNMEPLGARKPTELLAAMTKFRPTDDIFSPIIFYSGSLARFAYCLRETAAGTCRP
jgi:hypothetical protein